MDRLTVWESDYQGGRWTFHMDVSAGEIYEKLAAYEDTGLTPDEVVAMKRRVAGIPTTDGMRLVDANALAKEHPTVVSRSMKFNLDLAPTVEAEPVVHAHWVPVWDDVNGPRQGCSNCACVNRAVCSYCPECGARMDAQRKDGGESDA